MTGHQPTANASSAYTVIFDASSTEALPLQSLHHQVYGGRRRDGHRWGRGIRLLSADAVDMDSGVSRRPPRSRRRTSSADPLFAKSGFDSVTNLATASSGERLHHIPVWWPPRTLISDAVSLGGEDKRFGVVEGLIDFGAFHMKIR
ncbi:NB-ARC domain-containing disease resistance protein [Striga asiatica]|uniref:NB-ARC domain-containing disease resistance protein n=1 Tax=Striga asiatica TaxID=4170 RepID=A0A5A7QH61_STRAF|nr:NB-ARC domain-containing disease resistance protein [Striga asiatica]